MLEMYIFLLGAKVETPNFSNNLSVQDLKVLDEMERFNKGENLVLSKETVNYINQDNDNLEIIF